MKLPIITFLAYSLLLTACSAESDNKTPEEVWLWHIVCVGPNFESGFSKYATYMSINDKTIIYNIYGKPDGHTWAYIIPSVNDTCMVESVKASDIR